MIGIDIDGVIANTLFCSLPRINKLLTSHFTCEDFDVHDLYEVIKRRGGSEQDISLAKRVNKFVFSSRYTYRNIAPIVNASNILNKLTKKGITFFYISSRPSFLYTETKIWLGNNKFPKMPLYLTEGDFEGGKFKKHMTSKLKLEIFIEDNPKHIDNILQEKNLKKLFVFSQPWNKKMRISRKITKIEQWEQIYKSLTMD